MLLALRDKQQKFDHSCRSLSPIRRWAFYVMLVVCVGQNSFGQSKPRKSIPQLSSGLKQVEAVEMESAGQESLKLFGNIKGGEWQTLTKYAPFLSRRSDLPAEQTISPAVPTPDQDLPLQELRTQLTITKAQNLRPTMASDSKAGTTSQTPQGNPRVSAVHRPMASSRVKTTGPRRLYLPSQTRPVEVVEISTVSHTQSGDNEASAGDGVVVVPKATPLLTQIPLMATGEDTSLLQLPLTGENDPGEVNFRNNGELLALSFREAPLREVLGVLADSQGLNLICSSGAETKITGNFHSITFDDAMNTVLSASGHTRTRQNNVIIVTALNSPDKLAPEAQGREIRVFTLNYLSSSDVQKACTGLMSPVGTMVINESMAKDSHKTREQVMIEDLPSYIERITQLIAQLDVPPRQVLIEAHILEINLKDELAHGVDFSKLGSIAGTDILVSTPGFNGKITSLDTFSSPSYNIGIFNAGSFAGLIEALQKTTDAKTLASPKVLAIDGQEAHVQIGKRLGYYVTTTTQTSTLQSVQFLDTGVVLKVTPRITDDNKIMMTVKPEVSDGSVDSLGLPSSTTTEVETNIMLPDGQGMVIGGLIKETDVTRQQKIPVLGSLWYIGKLFRRNSVTRERSEIVIALVPRIVGAEHFDSCQNEMDVTRTTTPLLYGALKPYPRPWEPKFADAVENPRHLDIDRFNRTLWHPIDAPPQHLEYYFPPVYSTPPPQTMMFESIPVYNMVDDFNVETNQLPPPELNYGPADYEANGPE